MSMRDIVTGSDACTADGEGAGPSNAVGGLVNNLLGGASKTQEQLRELPQLPAGVQGGGPQLAPLTPDAAAATAAAGPSSMHMPGLVPPRMDGAGTSKAHDLFNSIAGPSAHAPPEWEGIFGQAPSTHRPPPLPHQILPPPGLAAQPPPPMPHPGGLLGPPPPLQAPAPAIAQHLHNFFSAARAGMPAGAALAPVPPAMAAQLSVVDKCRIRDRATIMSRHVYADQGDAFADQQVSNLLASLHINPAELPTEMAHVHDPKLHEAWAQSQQGPLSADVAAGARTAAENWDQIWGRHDQMARHRDGRPLSTGWANEFATSQAAGAVPGAPPLWADDFAMQQRRLQPPNAGHAWAESFAQQPKHPGQAWADGFAAEQRQGQAWADSFAAEQRPGEAWAEELSTAQAATAARTRNVSSADALQSTRALADVLSQDTNPKMRNSQFLQFVSKMSRGELMFEDNKVVERPAASRQWASEFDQQQQAMPPHAAAMGPNAQQWAAEFGSQEQRQQQVRAGVGAHPQLWGDEFASQLAQGLNLGTDEELERAWKAQGEAWQQQHAQSDDPWVQEFATAADEETFKEWERIYGKGEMHTVADSLLGPQRPKGEYLFSPDNPFLGDPEAFAKGKDLFRRGVLNEAVLALEAEVTARPTHSEAWRLLGTVQAENDDDQQAIAAMLRALAANPSSMDVLMALGVSHTNELDTGEAVQHLAAWLTAHPTYGQTVQEMGGPVPPDSSQGLSHVLRLFGAASRTAPGDAELQVALGVLHHLARQYDAAIAAFEDALKLQPQDYSLWNKLGATLANNSRSAEAIHAYQRALDLKPNYMRAWTNMGISFANIGDYERSARFYVRALQLNPAAPHVWGYLRTSLSCAGLLEHMPMVEAQDVNALGSALPLE